MVKYLSFFLFAVLITNSLDISKLSVKDYTEVKATLKSVVANRATKRPTYVEAQKWVDVVILELRQGCKLNKVNSRNIIDALNNCL